MTVLVLFAALNAVWQGIVLTVLVALVMRLLPRLNAATTCALWSATYVLVSALPFVDFFTARPLSAPPPAIAPTVLVAHAPRDPARNVPAGNDPAHMVVPPSAGRRSTGVLPIRATLPAAASTPDMTVLAGAANAIGRRIAPYVLALWFAAALAAIARLIGGYVWVLRLKRGARRLSLADVPVDLQRGRRAALGHSAAVTVPCAIGFRRPMIVLPATLAGTLDAADLARVVTHEHAHLRRYDDCLNAVERFIGALFFFHPALHYIARRIDFDREVACDDCVLDALGGPVQYAECLTKIVERRARAARFAGAPGFFFGRSQVIARVDRLIGLPRNASPHIARGGIVAAAALVLGAAALAPVQIPVIAAETPAGHTASGDSAPRHSLRDAAVRERSTGRSGARTRSHERGDLLDAVANTSPRPSVDELIALSDHGVDGSFVTSMQTLLPAKPTVAQLIALADHGVRPEFVRELSNAGYPHFSAQTLVDLTDAGVTTRLVERLNEHGFRNLSSEQLIKLAESGISR
jgi:beta-lactamase regulating signal transducer with metallopeptidase domain